MNFRVVYSFVAIINNAIINMFLYFSQGQAQTFSKLYSLGHRICILLFLMICILLILLM